MSSRRQVCKYCGDGPIPEGYDRRGTARECLFAGISVGTHKERRTWQKRLGIKVDAEYVSPCGQNRVYKNLRKKLMRKGRRRKTRHSSYPSPKRSRRSSRSRAPSRVRTPSPRSPRSKSRSRTKSRSMSRRSHSTVPLSRGKSERKRSYSR